MLCGVLLRLLFVVRERERVSERVFARRSRSSIEVVAKYRNKGQRPKQRADRFVRAKMLLLICRSNTHTHTNLFFSQGVTERGEDFC